MNFFKNLFKTETKKTEVILTEPHNNEIINEEIKKLEIELEGAEKKNRENILIKLGNNYFDLNDASKAIEYYELVIKEFPEADKPRMNLLKLYNIKRKEAAKNKDDDMIQFYLNKIDGIMQLNKEIMRKV